MSNVLPKETLQTEWSRFRDRCALVGGLVFLGAAAGSALALLPAHIALYVEAAGTAKQSAAVSGVLPDANTQAQKERADVRRAQALLDGVTPVVSSTSSPTEIISAALALRPSGVRVNHITFVLGDKNTMRIDGTSEGRERINQFRELLAKSGRFKNTSVPVGALVGAEGGKFSITLSGAL